MTLGEWGATEVVEINISALPGTLKYTVLGHLGPTLSREVPYSSGVSSRCFARERRHPGGQCTVMSAATADPWETVSQRYNQQGAPAGSFAARCLTRPIDRPSRPSHRRDRSLTGVCGHR